MDTTGLPWVTGAELETTGCVDAGRIDWRRAGDAGTAVGLCVENRSGHWNKPVAYRAEVGETVGGISAWDGFNLFDDALDETELEDEELAEEDGEEPHEEQADEAIPALPERQQWEWTGTRPGRDNEWDVVSTVEEHGDRVAVTAVTALGTHMTDAAWLEVRQVSELPAVVAEMSWRLSLEDSESERE